jgi:DNA-binding response OmpR family regulator
MLRPPCRIILWSDRPEALSGPLQAAGCVVVVADGENEAAELKASARPEAILLGEGQLSRCGRLRRTPPTLDLVYCALLTGEALARVDFSLGHDDFLRLPLRVEEIEARVRLWRWRRDTISGEGVLRVGPVVADLTNLRVTVDGDPVALTLKEYELLCLLMRRRGQILTRDYILDSVWGADYYGGNRTVDVHIRRLRMKIPELMAAIATVHGKGYRFDL